MVMTISLPAFPEPVATKHSLRANPLTGLRRAVAYQASDIVTPIYHAWKDRLKSANVTWQVFQSAASENGIAWEDWIDGRLPWAEALRRFVGLLNTGPATRNLILE